MKITVIARKLNLDTGGGSNRSLHLIAERLIEEHDVRVITVNSKQNGFRDLPYPVTEYNLSRSRAKEALGVKRIMQSTETDLFHIFNPGLLPGAGVYRKQNNTPVVGRLNTYTPICTNMSAMADECYLDCTSWKKSIHDSVSTENKLQKIPEYISRTHLVPRLVNNLDQLFAISPAVKEIYNANNYENITVIPNFIDEQFTSNIDTIKHKNNNTSFLYVGRLKKSKGVDLLVDAALEVDKPIDVDIVGDGPMRDILEKDVQTANSKSNIEFHGWIDYKNLPEFYTQSDIFVHPGRWPEPFGRTVLESLQCGTPCLVSDTGSPPWIVENAGITFHPGNSEDLVDKISYLNNNSDKIAKMENKISSRLSQFSRQTILDKLINEYNNVLELRTQS